MVFAWVNRGEFCRRLQSLALFCLHSCADRDLRVLRSDFLNSVLVNEGSAVFIFAIESLVLVPVRQELKTPVSQRKSSKIGLQLIAFSSHSVVGFN